MSVLDLTGIASSGGSLIVSAKTFSALDLRGIATAGKKSNAHLEIKDAGNLSALDCKGIASCHPGYVTFDFT